METISFGTITTSKLGIFCIGFSDRGLVRVNFSDKPGRFTQELVTTLKVKIGPADERVANLLRQIQDYLAGERTEFEVVFDWSGMTDFQIEVLQATFDIPYGETRAYGEIAVQVGRPRAARAVGRVEATNPFSLIVPCHRVIGADGKLHGYSGANGLETKTWLLEFEREVASKDLTPHLFA